MKTCRLRIGNNHDTQLIMRDISFFGEECPVKVISGWDEENDEANMPETLKDVAIVMQSMVGCGVTWQLAGEISKRLKMQDPRFVSNTLNDIFREYSELSDDESFLRYESAPRFPD